MAISGMAALLAVAGAALSPGGLGMVHRPAPLVRVAPRPAVRSAVVPRATVVASEPSEPSETGSEVSEPSEPGFDIGRVVRLVVYAGFAGFSVYGTYNSIQDIMASLGGNADVPGVPESAIGIAVDAFVLFVAYQSFMLDQTAVKAKEGRATAGPKVELPDTLAGVAPLPIQLQIPDESGAGGMQRRDAPIAELQAAAGQTLLLVAGYKDAVQEVLLSALVSGRQLAEANVLVVPLVASAANKLPKELSTPSAGLKAVEQPFVACAREADGAAWAEALRGELAEAIRQYQPPAGATKSLQSPLGTGVLLVVGAKQKVLQRRLGVPLSWVAFLEQVGKQQAEALRAAAE